MRILTVNCGSSSLKFDLFDAGDGGSEIDRLARGDIDRIGQEATRSLILDGKTIGGSAPVPDHDHAFTEAVALLREAGLADGIEAVGHRVVHGGRFGAPTPIDESVIAAIEGASALAPLHNLPALAAIKAARASMSAMPMVATFDTAFYADLPDVAALYALPRDLSERLGIRRFGFHGLAHRYMVERYRALRPDIEKPRLISLQLGNGCSATASLDGRPLDTSMGFTPLEGLIMGTRSGDIDPALPLFLSEQAGLSPREVDTLLNRESGLRGLSGRSNDVRDLLKLAAGGDGNADLALRAFSYRAKKYIGAYLAVLGGADALIFGGGIGEHSSEVRQQICQGLEWAGLTLDRDRNAATAGESIISAEGSPTEAWVVAVDEAAVMARDTANCLAAR